MDEAAPLIKHITKQLTAEREALLDDAQREADEIRQDAEHRAQLRRDEALAALETELADLELRNRERAEAEAQMAELTAKDTINDELLDDVRAELSALAAGDGFAAIRDALLEELLAESGTDGVLIAPEAQLDAVKAWAEAHGHEGLPVQPDRRLKDGVALQDAAHTQRVTNSLSGRYALVESELRKYCAERLFGEGS